MIGTGLIVLALLLVVVDVVLHPDQYISPEDRNR